jgi:WD40 repeat protein
MMVCCLNPDCPKPINPEGQNYCHTCGRPLVSLLRNRFHVIRVLSDEGGFCRTYLAEDVDKLNERCVIKQFAPKVQGTWAFKKAMELFQQEAQRLQDLGEHPQIPTLIAYFEQDQNMYLVEQFIDGQNLYKELKNQGNYNAQKIRQLLLSILPILKYIHEHDVIHRDIKPHNIIRRKTDGRLSLIDFGSSKQLSANVQTKVGTAIGSHGYSPLEQIKEGKATPASDLFSLGVTCFHLLTDVSPSTLWMDNGYSWVNHWREYVLQAGGNDVIQSPSLFKVLDKLLQKEEKNRYQHADEVLQDLAEEDKVYKSHQSNQSSSLPRTTSVTLHSSSTTQKRQLQAGQLQAGKLQSGQLKTGQLKTGQLQAGKIPRGQIKTRIILGAIAIISIISVIGGLSYWQLLRGQTIINIKNQSQTPPANQTSTITNLSLANTLRENSQPISSIAITPNGQELASNSKNNIKLWNLNSGLLICTLKGHSHKINTLAISPNGEILASGAEDNTIRLWNLLTRKNVLTLKGHANSIHALGFSADGKNLVSGSDDLSIKLWDLSTGEEIRTFKGHSTWIRSVVISPDNQILASSSFDKDIKIWNLQTGEEIRTLNGHKAMINSLAISSNAQTLASVSDDTTTKLWNLSTGQEMMTLKGHISPVSTVAFSPDGKTLVTGGNDDSIKIWDVNQEVLIRTLKGHSQAVNSIALSADGKTLASGSGDMTIKIWRVDY